jgi:hypothetical protein
MARRKKTSPAEDLLELVAMLPWWTGVALALLSCALLQRIAVQPLAVVTGQPGQVGAILTQGLRKGGAAGEFVAPSGRFTDAAVSFASGRNVMLVDGPKLVGLIRQAKAGAGQPAPRIDAANATTAGAAAAQATACPWCSKPMLRRTAKRGANAGSEFWGCAVYPACRGTRTFG